MSQENSVNSNAIGGLVGMAVGVVGSMLIDRKFSQDPVTAEALKSFLDTGVAKVSQACSQGGLLTCMRSPRSIGSCLRPSGRYSRSSGSCPRPSAGCSRPSRRSCPLPTASSSRSNGTCPRPVRSDSQSTASSPRPTESGSRTTSDAASSRTCGSGDCAICLDSVSPTITTPCCGQLLHVSCHSELARREVSVCPLCRAPW